MHGQKRRANIDSTIRGVKMFHRIRSNHLIHRSFMYMVLVGVIGFGLLAPIAARQSADAAKVAPEAGTWKTWVLESAKQFEIAAPPDAAATTKEIAQLMDMAAKRDETALQQIA